jgi:enoyl-CoA hydratase
VAEGTRVAIDGGVAYVAIDDGKRNALSAARLGELAEALGAAEAAGALVVLRGREGIFSAGFDLGTFQRGQDATLEMLRAGASLILRLLAFPRPVLTVCTGHAYPMGAFLMLAADVRFALAGDWKIGMNEIAIGLTVPRFALEIARHRLTPAGFARITTATMFAPDEALRAGYVDRVLDADSLEIAVAEEVARLRTLNMDAFAATKARINERAIAAISAAIESELSPGAAR